MKYFDREFREREAESAISRKDIDYYRAMLMNYKQKTAELSESAVAGKTQAWTEAHADLGRAASRLGEALRFAGQIPEALEYKRRSLAIWEMLERPRAICLARIRLAVVLDQAGHTGQALEILRELREALNSGGVAGAGGAGPELPGDLTVYADFVHESLALVLIRSGDVAAAAPELHAALEIRLRRGHARTIERTRELLRRIE